MFKPPRLPGPWVFRKMIRAPEVSTPNGAYLALRDRHGKLLGRGFLNRRSEIAFRVVATPGEPADARALFDLRLRQATRLRESVLGLKARTDAWRLVHGEGDGLSGLIVDRYGKTLVVSVYAQGYIANAEALEASLRALEGVDRVVFIGDARSQDLEGFRLPAPPPGLHETVHEGPVRYRVDLSEGHKTGLFLDQRDNRRRLAELVAGKKVCDLATNAGGFALAAATVGRAKRVLGVDLDERVLETARTNARLNQARIDFVHADLFPWLRERHAAGESFDVVVLDPPKLARNRSEFDRAIGIYRDMNVHALRAVAPGGLLMSFSCSGAVDERAFHETLRRAGAESGRRARILEYLGAGADHPVALDFPEGRYLKGALLQVD